jgi:hypothetical protein
MRPQLEACLAFSLTDLFIVGLGLDATGAILLLRGLVISPAAIARLNTFAGLESGDTLDRCENRVDAIYGGAGLLLGFFLQAVGYALELSGVNGGSGTDRLLTAILLGLLAVALSLLIYLLTKERLFKRTVAAVAKARAGSGDPGDEKGPAWSRVKAQRLVRLGEAAGWPRLETEQDEGTATNYAKRIFRIDVPPFPIDDP